MSDAEEVIDYLRTLTRGYDTRVFDRNLDELNAIVLDRGLSENEFHGLVRVWLNSNVLAINKWIEVGLCVIPSGHVLDNSLRLLSTWALSQWNHTSVSRIKFVVNWLTAAMDLNLLNIDVLDTYYELFFNLFFKERYAPIVLKLVYTLTKPFDVIRSRVTQLLRHQKKIKNTKRKNEVNLLLSLFKSYKPECVPESIPSIAIQSMFPKVHTVLMERLRNVQSRVQNDNILESVHLEWQLSATVTYAKKSRAQNQVVPDLEFLRLGSTLYSGENTKTYLHCKKNVDVLRFCQKESIARPAQLVSLLCNDTGQMLLAFMDVECHSQLSHRLMHLLHNCLLEDGTQYTLRAKTDFLRRLANFQYIIQQPVPVVTNFLITYLPAWNGLHHCQEVWQLLEWVTFDSFDEMNSLLLKPIESHFAAASPVKRYLMLKSLARMYSNLCFTMTKKEHIFFNIPPNPDAATELATEVATELATELATFIERLCRKYLQTHRANTLAQMSCLYTYDVITRAEFFFNNPAFTVAPVMLVGCVLLSSSAVALDTLARLMLDYAKFYKKFKRTSKAAMRVQQNTVEAFAEDIVNALWFDEIFSSREDGLIYKRCTVESCEVLEMIYKDASKSLSINSHFALAPYTYVPFDMAADEVTTKSGWLEVAIAPMLRNLHTFILRLTPS